MSRRVEPKKTKNLAPTNVLLVDNWEVRGFVPQRAPGEKQELDMMFTINGRHNRSDKKDRVRLAFSSEDTVSFITDTARAFNKVMIEAKDFLKGREGNRISDEDLDQAAKLMEDLIAIADGMHRALKAYNEEG